MLIDVECKGCHAHYRVKEELAGRMAACKRCGQKFRVPYRSPVVTLGEENVVEDDDQAPDAAAPEAQPTAAPGRTFEEYGFDLKDQPKRKETTKDEAVAPILPPIVSELWLPLGVTLLCYGVAIFMAVSRVVHTPGWIAGVILIAVAAAAFMAFVVPMTIRAIDGASGTLDFKLPNAVWLQTIAAIAPATLGTTIGFLNGGVAGAIAGGLIGLALAVPLMMLMYGIDILKALQAGVLAGLMYALSMAGTAGVLAALGLFFFPLWQMKVPWETYSSTPASVASTTPPPATAPATPPPVVEKPAAPETPQQSTSLLSATTQPTTPQVAAPVAPPEPPKPQIVWAPAVDPAPPIKWPPNIHYLIEVKPPAAVAGTSSTGAIVMVVDKDSTETYDLRAGASGGPPKRLGFIKDRIEGNLTVSPGGKYFIAQPALAAAPAPAYGFTPAAPRVQALSPDVRSTADGRVVLRLAAAPGQPTPKIIGFAGDDKLLTIAWAGQKTTVQVWDAASGQAAKSFEASVGETNTVSAGGRYLATVAPGQMRTNELKIYDIETGEMIGQSPLPPEAQTVRALAFSNNGAVLAALIPQPAPTAAPAPPSRLLLFDTATGKVLQEVITPTAALAAATAPDFRWLPDDQGFLLGSDLIDRVSGKPFMSARPPLIPNTTGKLRAVMSNYAILFEYTPSGTAERVIYKSNAMPKAEVDRVLTSLRGAKWAPEETDARIAAGATTMPAVAAAAPPRAAVPALAAQKQWLVTVITVSRADTQSIDEQIKAEQNKLPDIERRFDEARVYADRLASDFDYVRDSRGNQIKKLRHQDREIGDAKVAADRINEEKRSARAHIARLEREKSNAATTRTVAGRLDDGTVVQIDVEGAAMVAIVDGLTPSTRWTVTGGGRIENTVLHIKPRTLTPAP